LRPDEAKREYYRRRAREEGYRSRAAYKLKQMNQRFHFLRFGSVVVDIGAAPGGWLEVVSQTVGSRGKVIGVDLDPIEALPNSNVVVFQDDVTSPGFAERIENEIGKGKADCVLADLSPKLSGVWDMDHYKQIDLCHSVMDMLPEILDLNGSIVMKAFQGNELSDLIQRLKLSFAKFEISKPEASRKQSSEVYLFARGFKGRVAKRETEDEEEKHQYEEPSDLIASDSL